MQARHSGHPFKIAIVAVPGGNSWLGGVNYIKNLIRSLTIIRNDPGRELSIVLVQHSATESPLYSDIYDLVDEVLIIDNAKSGIIQRTNNLIKRKLRGIFDPQLEQLLRDANVDFVYSRLMYRNQIDAPIRSACWLPDFQFVHLPEGSEREHGKGQLTNFELAAVHSAKIVLSSYDAQSDCLKILPKAAGRTHVFQFKACLPDSIFQSVPNETLERLTLPSRFLLVVNLLAPTKNHLCLIAALGLLKRQGKSIPVVCTGSVYDYRNPGFANEIWTAITKAGVHRNLQFTGPLERADQLQLMRAAVAIVQPSRFEGWNTGVEEARCLGKSLVLSDLAVHREQVQHAYWFDDSDPTQLAVRLESAFNQEAGFDDAAEILARNRYLIETRSAAEKFVAIARA